MIFINGLRVRVGNEFVNGAKVPYSPSDTIQIGTQLWMSKNLDYDDGLGGIWHTNITVNGYDLGEQYYYTKAAAQRVASEIKGWHLPTNEEYNTLFNYVGGTSIAGKKLKSTYAWANDGNGTDDFGFCSLPVGYGNMVNSGPPTFDYVVGYYEGSGAYTYYWTETDNNGVNFWWSSDTSSPQSTVGALKAISVRLIHD